MSTFAERRRDSGRRDAELFTATLFAGQPAGSLLVVSTAPNWAEPHFVTSPGGVVDYAVGTVDAFVRPTPIARRPPRGKRAGDELTAAVLGVAVDLDVDGSPDGKGGTVTGACPDLGAAQDLAHALLEPTLTVGSGLGLQPYWLLAEPILVSSDGDLAAAAEFTRGWWTAMQAAASAAGVRKFDAVADLSRVMRIPGSLNGKGDRPVAVRLIDDGGPRHDPKQLVAHVRRNGARGPDASAPTTSPDRVAAILDRHDDLARIVAHRTKKPGDGSLSAWDFQLGCRAAEHDLLDPDLAALIRHYRALHKDAKGERADYVERTIEAVRRRVGYPARDPGEILPQLTDLLEVGQVVLKVVGVEVSGDGNAAPVVIHLDDGTPIFFERFEHVGKPDKLATQLASTVGVWTEFSPLQARKAAGLIRRYVGRAQVIARHELFASWVIDLLEEASDHDFDLDDQASRWSAWKAVKERHQRRGVRAGDDHPARPQDRRSLRPRGLAAELHPH